MATEMQVLEFEVTLNQPAWLVWQTHIKNFQVTLPQVVENHFKSVEYLEGPPVAPGGVFKISYHEGFEHYDYMKFKWEEVDHEKFYCKVTLIDGGALGKHFHDLSYHYAVVPGVDEKHSTIKWKFEYRDIGEHDFHKVLQDELVMWSTSLHDHINTLKTE